MDKEDEKIFLNSILQLSKDATFYNDNNCRALSNLLEKDTVDNVLRSQEWYVGFYLEKCFFHWKTLHGGDDRYDALLKRIQDIVDWREQCFDEFHY